MSTATAQARQQAAAATPASEHSPRKAALASWIGSAVEYYDFFIYGTAAALVFGKIFFPAFDPATAAIAAFATFGVAYITRPIGAVMLGHIGDKYGRKKVLTFTLLLMGVSTFLVGLLPTYNQAGILSPIMLVVLRMLQGISAAGEQAGANSMTLEHAPPHRRAFFTSFTLSGTQAGLILATLVFLPISALPEEQLLSWGWRIPFFLSAMAIGTQIGFALGGFAPTISAAILRPNDPMGWVPVAAFVTCTSIISAFAVFTGRETCRVPMQDLGKN